MVVLRHMLWDKLPTWCTPLKQSCPTSKNLRKLFRAYKGFWTGITQQLRFLRTCPKLLNVWIHTGSWSCSVSNVPRDGCLPTQSSSYSIVGSAGYFRAELSCKVWAWAVPSLFTFFAFAMDPLFTYLNRIPGVISVQGYVDDTTIAGDNPGCWMLFQSPYCCAAEDWFSRPGPYPSSNEHFFCSLLLG